MHLIWIGQITSSLPTTYIEMDSIRNMAHLMIEVDQLRAHEPRPKTPFGKRRERLVHLEHSRSVIGLKGH